MTYGVPGILKPTFQSAGEKVREIGEFHPPSKIFVEILLNGCAVVVKADFYIVLVELPGKVVDDLVIGIEAVTRNAAGGSELGEAAHQDNGHSGVKRSAPATLTRVAGGAEVN